MKRLSASLLGLVLGIGAALSIACMYVYDSVLQAQTDELPRQAKLDQFWWIGVILAGIALLLVGSSFYSRKDRRFRVPPSAIPATAVLLYCLLPVYLKRMPSISEGELAEVREGAIPLIEKLTGLRFTEAPPIELGSFEEYIEGVRSEHEQSGSGNGYHPVYLGLYREETRGIEIFLDSLDDARKDRGLYAGETRDTAHRLVIHELAHALEHQNGRSPTDAELIELWSASTTAFYIQRALQEGHASWVAAVVGKQMGLEDPSDVRRGFRTEDNRVDPVALLYVEPSIKLLYEDGMRFMEAVFRQGGSELIGEVYAAPPLWLYHLRQPETYLSDRDTGHYEQQLKAVARLDELVKTKGWSPFQSETVLAEMLDRDFLRMSEADREGLVGRRVGVFGRVKDGKMDLDGPLGGLEVWRFMSPQSAESYLEVVKEDVREDPEDDETVTEHRLKNEQIGDTFRYDHFYPATDGEDSSTSYYFLAQRGVYVFRFNAERRKTKGSAMDLWDSIITPMISELTRKPK